MLATMNILSRQPISNSGAQAKQQKAADKGGLPLTSDFGDTAYKRAKSTNGGGNTVKRIIAKAFSFIKDIVKMFIPAFIGKNMLSSKSDSGDPNSGPPRSGGGSPLKGLSQPGQSKVGRPDGQGQGWVLPPAVYGNTAGLGIFVSLSLLPVIEEALKDPIVRKLFGTAKKKGLVSITIEPSLQYETRPVRADEIRDTGTGESRIRIANAGDRFAMASLVHELVHSATPENLNSKVEEYYAENIGRGIYRRITGDTTLAMKPFSDIRKMYTYLPEDNHIRQDLLHILG